MTASARRARAVARVGMGAVCIGAAACALVAPRRGSKGVDARWAELSRYRYAHRGLHDNRRFAPENSLAAFRLARERGYGSELDVHLSDEGDLPVLHDSDLMRACGVSGEVEHLPRARRAALRLFGTAEGIPTLPEVLRIYEEGEGPCPPLVVELKTHGANYARLAEAALACLDAHKVPYCMESFDPRVLAWLRWHRPDVVRGQLSENYPRNPDAGVSLVPGALHAALLADALARPDFIAYRFEHRSHPAVRLACNLLGAHRVYWTITSPEQLAVADAEGAISIFEGFEPQPLRS